MCPKIGLGNQAQFGEHMIEPLAALSRGALRSLQGQFVDGFGGKQKSAELFKKNRAARVGTTPGRASAEKRRLAGG